MNMAFLSRIGSILGLLALILTAVAVPFAAAGETTIKVPVVPGNLRQGLICTAETLRHIEITVSGPPSQLETLPSLKLTYDLNLADADIGFHVLPARRDAVKLPQDISITAFAPPQIQVRLDREIEKDLPVTIVCNGDPAPGYVIVKTEAVPERVLLKGPKLLIDGLEHIATHPVDVSGASESFKKEAPLVFSENVRMIPAVTPIVALVHIGAQIVTRTLDAVQVQGRNTPRAFDISPAFIHIRVKGPANVVSDLAAHDDFNVYIDLKDLQPGVFVRRAVIELPIDTALVEVEPKVFTVTVR